MPPLRVDEYTPLLRAARVVAVIGAHRDPSRPAFYVPDALHRAGVRILPVNAALVGETLWGEPVRASLTEIDVPVDIVNVFRRSEAVAAHLPEILAMKHPPGLVWLQLGIRDDATLDRLAAEGIPGVQDSCLMVEYRAAGR